MITYQVTVIAELECEYEDGGEVFDEEDERNLSGGDPTISTPENGGYGPHAPFTNDQEMRRLISNAYWEMVIGAKHRCREICAGR